MYTCKDTWLFRFELENNNIDKDKGRDAFQILLISYS